MPSVDWNNPCARFQALQTAYFQLISGGTTAKISYLANGVQRSREYSVPNLAALKLEMQKAESACCIANGQADPNRRFAITAGAYRGRVNGSRRDF